MGHATVAPWAHKQKLRTIETHYRRIADDYDRLLYYSPEFVAAVSSKAIEALDLTPSDRFVDLGCGTGMYTVAIANRIQFQDPITAVDPYIEMLRQVPERPDVRTVMMDAMIFSRQVMVYDKVLMKESVHHVADRANLFGNLYRRLPKRGRVLLVGVPPDIDYPLFDAALERSRTWHADPGALAIEMRDAGFAVSAGAIAYDHDIPKDTYFEMVRTKYMSLLSSFSDEEIEHGLREMKGRYANFDILQFTDKFHLVLGVKQS